MQNRRTFLNRGRALLGAVAVAFTVAAGCAPKPDVNNTKAPGAPVAVRLAFFPNVTHAAALYGTGTGAFRGAFGDAARLEERVFSAGPAEIEALFAGEVDLGYIGPGPALNGYLKSKGDALRIIAGAASGGAALVARQGVEIDGVKGLDGKRVAVPQTGGTQDISLRHALSEAGLRPREKGGTVDVVQYAPADTLNQFRLKSVDAAWVPEPWVARLEKEAGARVVVDERDLWPDRRFSTAVVIARMEFLERHPDLVERFLKAHARSVREINEKPDAARKVIGARIAALSQGKALPEDILVRALSRTEITSDPLDESVLTFADWSKDLGYQREDRTALAGLFANETLARVAAGADPSERDSTSASAGKAAAAP